MKDLLKKTTLGYDRGTGRTYELRIHGSSTIAWLPDEDDSLAEGRFPCEDEQRLVPNTTARIVTANIDEHLSRVIIEKFGVNELLYVDSNQLAQCLENGE